MHLRFAGCMVILLTGITATGRAQEATRPLLTAPAASATTEPQTDAGMTMDHTIGDFLEKFSKSAGPEADSPYAAVPARLEQAVRYIAMDNFTSAAVEMLPIYQASTEGKDKAETAMWMGINYGLQAINYPNTGWESGTSATTYLKEAMHLDPKVIEAPDACRIMAEMVAHGWGNEDPATALKRAEQKAEETRRPMDFYFAGVISRRLSARAWGYSDTTEEDKKTLSLFSKSLAIDANRYEIWSAYLPSLMPAGMHDLATTEAAKMYNHFKNLRTPLLADQGPAVLMINTSSYRTMEGDAATLAEVASKWPDAPMPPFETAMRAIETSPALAMDLFPKLIADFESKKLKPTPREAGYYPSALYKYAFLLQSFDRIDESIEYYKKVKALSPGYAEVNMNIGILLAMKSDKESTGPKKLALLQEALTYVEAQEKLDYRGKAALKANEMRQRLRSHIYRMKQALKEEQTTATTSGS